MDKRVSKFIYDTFQELFGFMNPYLSNYQKFSQSLSKQIKVKDHNNIQYNFDVVIDGKIKKNLKAHGITGRIFSEESNFFDNGPKKYRVVYDPFCNSTLASKTFLEAAVGITIFDYDYNFISSAVMDYQTGIMGIVEDRKTNFYQVQTKRKLDFSHTSPVKLSESDIVFTLEGKKERKYIAKAQSILTQANRVLVSSGHYYWLKLATGKIDAYLDPYGGEELYEMFASAIAHYAGCIVTDIHNKPFDPVFYLKTFEQDMNFVFYPVAARNKKVHSQLLKSL